VPRIEQTMFTFRPLEARDLPTVHAWMNAPHARRWFGHSLEVVERDYGAALRGEEPFDAWIVAHEGREAALFTRGRFGDFPEMARAYGVDDPEAVNCDVLIGEPSLAHRGMGPRMIRAFLDRVFDDARVTQVIIDPVPDNAIAIRAYEKVGFRFREARPDDGEGNGLYLMALSREEHPAGVTSAPFVIRPGRPEEISLAEEIDDDACEAYRAFGLPFELPSDHPFFAMERERWARSLAHTRLLFAETGGVPVGFAALGHVNGRPHVEQLSVRVAHQGRGIGRALLERALRWSVREGELWLSTYASVPWNAPWYARMGFVRASDAETPPELRALVDAARRTLPNGRDQIAMVCRGEAHARHRRAGGA
jgi:aminoglycoside 6'-N-acetyltransferase